MPKIEKQPPTYKPKEKEVERIAWLQDRWEQMDSSYRKKKLGDKYNKWDKLYRPHNYQKTGLAAWQENSSKNIAFTKIQTAISLLIDQNPERQLFGKTKLGENKLPLWKGLTEYTDDVGNAKEQWKDFGFDLAKYGTAVGQEYWRYETREVTVAGDKQTVVDFNNPYWRVLPIREVRYDEKAKSWDPKSEDRPRDWFRRRVMDFEDFKRRYPEDRFPKAEFCKPGGDLKDDNEMKPIIDVGKKQIEVLYYENEPDDKCSILANGVLIKDIPLPFKHKRLSLFGANWWKRSTEDIEGIGIPEAIENDEALIDKINNTNMDQILLDIYKVLIIGLGEEIEDEELDLEPNKVLRLRNPETAQWLSSSEKAGNAKHDAMTAIEQVKEDIDEKTGITKQLAGALMGKTATETAINREAGLRRMKTPLAALEKAMTWHTKLRISMIKQVYSIPAGEKEIPMKGLRGILMSRKVPQYRTIRLNVEKKGDEFKESERPDYVEITPEMLFEEPDVKIKHMSTIPVSKALERQRAMETFSLNLKLPYTDIYKLQRWVNKKRGEDPDDIMMSEKAIKGMQKQAKGFTTGQVEKEAEPSGERVARPGKEGVAETPISAKKSGLFSKVGEKLGLLGK